MISLLKKFSKSFGFNLISEEKIKKEKSTMLSKEKNRKIHTSLSK